MVRHWSVDGFGDEEPWSCDPKRGRFVKSREERRRNLVKEEDLNLKTQGHQAMKTIARRKVSPRPNSSHAWIQMGGGGGGRGFGPH